MSVGLHVATVMGKQGHVLLLFGGGHRVDVTVVAEVRNVVALGLSGLYYLQDDHWPVLPSVPLGADSQSCFAVNLREGGLLAYRDFSPCSSWFYTCTSVALTIVLSPYR